MVEQKLGGGAYKASSKSLLFKYFIITALLMMTCGDIMAQKIGKLNNLTVFFILFSRP